MGLAQVLRALPAVSDPNLLVGTDKVGDMMKAAIDPKDAKGEYEYQPGKPLGAHRQLAKKMLQLNFWRRGDEFLEHEGEIGLGLPGELDYTWAYR